MTGMGNVTSTMREKLDGNRQGAARNGRRPSLRRRLGRDEGGATAVEFALLLPVFMYLLIGIIEMAMMFYTMTVVDNAVHAAGRRIRTGQAQLSNDTLNTFKVNLCNSLYGVYNCNNITLDIRTFGTFSSVSMPIQVDADGNVINTQFSMGGAGQIQAIRATYNWTFFTPMIKLYFGTGGGNTRRMTSTTVFKNEPYQ